MQTKTNPTLRDETKPRQSALFSFLSEEEFDSIPEDTLHNKACEGIEKHNILEVTYRKDTVNILARMFADGLGLLFSDAELESTPVFEEQLNGSRFTGKPDFVLGDTMIDYKFCLDLRNKTALQLVAYNILEHELNDLSIERSFAFHFPTDTSLFVHRVSQRVVPVLVEFVNFVIDNHASIAAGDVVKYEALTRWKEIQRDYEIFVPVADVLPPMMITSDELLISEVTSFYHIKELKDIEKLKGREIRRYMEAQGLTRIEDASGCGVRLEIRNNKTHDPIKKAAAKEIHDAAKAACVTGTVPSVILKRFAPRKKKAKQIN